MLLSMFLRQVRVVPELEFDITLIDRLPEVHRRRTYTRLRATVDNIIDRQRVKVYREQTLQAQNGKKTKLHATPAADRPAVSPKAKAKGKAKKDKARAPSPTPSLSAVSVTSSTPSAGGGKGVCHNFSKDSKCTFGDDCKYKHIKSDGTVLHPGKPLVKGKGKGKGKNDKSSSAGATPPGTPRLCHFHHKPTGCRDGAACKFSHADKPKKVPASVALVRVPALVASN